LASPDSAGFSFVSAAHWLRGSGVLVADAQYLGLFVYDTAREVWAASGRRVVTYWIRTELPGPFPPGVRSRAGSIIAS
jgi:hypothetical protein